MVAPYLFLFTIYEGGAPSQVYQVLHKTRHKQVHLTRSQQYSIITVSVIIKVTEKSSKMYNVQKNEHVMLISVWFSGSQTEHAIFRRFRKDFWSVVSVFVKTSKTIFFIGIIMILFCGLVEYGWRLWNATVKSTFTEKI